MEVSISRTSRSFFDLPTPFSVWYGHSASVSDRSLPAQVLNAHWQHLSEGTMEWLFLKKTIGLFVQLEP